MILQAYVNCDVPGMREVDYGSGFVVVSGYLPWLDYLAAIEAALQAAGVDYVVAYVNDRVTLTKQSGSDAGFTLESQSMAQLWGLDTPADFVAPAASHVGVRGPGGCVPLVGAAQTESTSGRHIVRRDYAPRRPWHVAFGRGTIHGLRLTMTKEAAERATAGPCVVGRVRVGAEGASGALGPSLRAGYVDGSVVTARRVRTDGPTEALAYLDLQIHHEPAVATPADWNAAWGSLSRGYALVCYAIIEGIPHVFSERQLALSFGTLAETATLVVAEEQAHTLALDRESGALGGSALRLAVRDPYDDLGIFRSPSLRSPLTADLDPGDTSLAIATSAWPSTGGVYVGLEYATYTGKSAGALTGLTRQGPEYYHRANAPLSWAVASDRPIQWQGRAVELWAALVDAYGAAVGLGHVVQIWAGKVRTRPTYEGGAWVIDCESMAEVLGRPPGLELAGECAVYGLLTGSQWGPVVVVPSDAECAYEIWDGTGPHKTGRFALSTCSFPVIELTLTGYFALPIRSLASGLESRLRGIWNATPGLSNAINPIVVGVERSGSEWRVVFEASQKGVFPGDGYWRIGPISIEAGVIPEWSVPITISAETLGESGGSALKVWSAAYPIGLDGRTTSAMVLRAPTDADALTPGDWPTTGGFVVADQEALSYEAAFTNNGRTYIYGMTRGLGGTPPADVTEDGLSVAGYASLGGNLGEQVLTVLQSSGVGDRGSYDTESAGYGLSDLQVDESSIEAIGGPLQFATPYDLSQSVGDIFGGALASQGLSLGWVRSGQRLKIGARAFDPFGVADVALRDADLVVDAVPQIPANGMLPTPNIIRLTPSELGGVKRSAVTVALLESIAAEGAREQEYSLPWVSSPIASLLLVYWAQQAIVSRASSVAYAVQVTPERDWLPGQVVDISTTHPGFFDPATGTQGLVGRGVILETQRRLAGACQITMLVRRDSTNHGPLCPTSAVLAVDVPNKTVTVADGSLFEAGADVLIYHAGVDGRYDVETIATVAGDVLTLGAVPVWLDSAAVALGGVVVTYPPEGSPNITPLQASHVHFRDGNSWL